MLQNSASKPNTKDAAAGPGSKVRASSQGLARAWQPRVQWNQVHAWAARRLRADPGLLTSSGKVERGQTGVFPEPWDPLQLGPLFPRTQHTSPRPLPARGLPDK